MSNKIAISLALTGARYSPWLQPVGGIARIPDPNFRAKYMPLSPREIAYDVADAAREGAVFFHAHARNPETGAQYANPVWYQQTAELVREIDPQLLLSFPTSRKMEVGTTIDAALAAMQDAQGTPPGLYDRAYYELKIRGAAVEAKPDTLTTFTVPEVKMFGKPKDSRGVEDVPGWNDPEVMRLYYHGIIQRTKELGVIQEIEITTMGQFDVLRQMAESGEYHMDAPIHFVILLGFSNGLPINRETYEQAIRNVQELRDGVQYPTCITVGAVIRPKEAQGSMLAPLAENKHDYYEVMEWVVDDARVDIFRVGLEDTPELYGKQLTNLDLVRHAVDFFDNRGRGIETDPIVLRTHLGSPVREVGYIAPEVSATPSNTVRLDLNADVPEFPSIEREAAPTMRLAARILPLSKARVLEVFQAVKDFNNDSSIVPGESRYETLMSFASKILEFKASSKENALLVHNREDGGYSVWVYDRSSEKPIRSFGFTCEGKLEYRHPFARAVKKKKVVPKNIKRKPARVMKPSSIASSL